MATPKRKRKKQINKKPIYALLGILIFVVVCVYLYKQVFVAKIEGISVTGNNFNTVEEFKHYMFKDAKEVNTIELFFADKYKDKKTIPYVETYKVKIKWPNKVTITVYEKKIMGYVKVMNNHMYFDKDGIVVESSTEQLEGIPQIVGIGNDSITLHNKIETDIDGVFADITKIKQLLDKYNITLTKLEFDFEANAILYINHIRVLLGEREYIEEKIFELSQLYDKVYNLKGELDLKNCNGDAGNIIFKPD